MGRGYSLQVRTKDSVEFRPLGYVFWISPDGGYHSYKKDASAVENKIWVDEKHILQKATEILHSLRYL